MVYSFKKMDVLCQNNKHRVFTTTTTTTTTTNSSNSIFYRTTTTTAVSKIPTNLQNCITEEILCVTPIFSSARLPATK